RYSISVDRSNNGSVGFIKVLIPEQLAPTYIQR
ncbi:hypothetical protein GCK32_022175, partial [Trichostrongylus colubriformis]